VSDELEILSSGGLVRFDGLLLTLDHYEFLPWVRLVSWGCARQKHNRGFGSWDQNWRPCRYAHRTLLYGHPTLCGAVGW
jgi:hypothetical protein